MADLAEREGAVTRYLPSLRQPVDPWADTRALMELTRICREFRPDVVHTHTAKAGFVGRMAALTLRPRPKIVHTFHGHVLRGYFGAAKTRTFLELERRLARRTDGLVGVSEQTVAELVALGVAERERFRVIPLGLDLDPFLALDGSGRAAARENSACTPGTSSCASSGASPRSSGSTSCWTPSSWPAPRGRGPPGAGGRRRGTPRAAGAGRAPGTGRRRQLPRLQARPPARLRGGRRRRPLLRQRGHPGLIDRGGRGRPARGRDRCRRCRFRGDPAERPAGPSGDPRALGEAIAAMASDAQRRDEMGLAAREHVRTRFSAERLVGDIDSLYRELLA